MHRRHTRKNIPIELLRALVTIVDTGSYTKAGDALDLTQPAISAQIARLGQLLGGSIFARELGSMTPTKRGKLVLQYARRMLAINDELLAFAGPNSAPRQLVIGLPPWLGHQQLITVFERCSANPTGEQVSFRCDRAERLVGDLHIGSLDIVYLCNVIDPPGGAVAQWTEQMVWVKSPKLALTPGAPIPLISWPGTTPDRIAVELLQDNGMQFFVAFSAPDFSARLTAVVAGLGVLPVPARAVTSAMQVVRDGLPALPENRTGIFAREGLDLDHLAPLLRTLTEALAPKPLAERAAAGSAIKKLPPGPRRVRASTLRRAG
jgi:DNA-binding transcriptional LysR family regulator